MYNQKSVVEMDVSYSWTDYLQERSHPFARILTLLSLCIGFAFILNGILFFNGIFLIGALIWYVALQSISRLFFIRGDPKSTLRPAFILKSCVYDTQLFKSFLLGNLKSDLNDIKVFHGRSYNWDLFRWVLLSSSIACVVFSSWVSIYLNCANEWSSGRCDVWRVLDMFLGGSFGALIVGNFTSTIGLVIYYFVSSEFWKVRKHGLIYFLVSPLIISTVNGATLFYVLDTGAELIWIYSICGLLSGLFHSVILQNIAYPKIKVTDPSEPSVAERSMQSSRTILIYTIAYVLVIFLSVFVIS